MATTPPAGPAPVATPPTGPVLPPQMPALDDEGAWSGLPAWVKALRTENAKHRVEKNALEQKVADFERAKLTAEQQVVADLKNRDEEVIPGLRRDIQRLQVQVAASKLGVVDPEAAAVLLDWPAVQAGTSIDDALAALVAQRPWLKQAASPAAPTAPPSASSPASPPGGSTPPSFTKSQLNAMSRQQIDAQWDQIQAAMQSGRVDYSR